MAREIETVIVLDEKQTAEFLAKIAHPRNVKRRDRMLKRAMSMKFNVIR